MGTDVKKVYVGAPYQNLTVGAVQTAPVGTACPASARAALSADWDNGTGYVSQDGVTLAQDRSTETLKDWGLNAVRTLLTDFTGTVQFAEMETSYETMCRMVGDGNVTLTPADAANGEQLLVAIGPEMPPARAWCFSMKDEDRRMRIFIPNGQITAVDNTTFVKNSGVVWPFTITCNDDGTGHCIYILTDDGAIVADGTTYTITASSSTHGTYIVSANGSQATGALAGAQLQIITAPASGYVVDSVAVVDAASNPVSVDAMGNFVMPAANVTVSVSFKSA